MSLKSDCEASVLEYAPLHKQLNAHMFNEYKEYISVVITLHRDEYEVQKANGDSTFVLSEGAKQMLTEESPF